MVKQCPPFIHSNRIDFEKRTTCNSILYGPKSFGGLFRVPIVVRDEMKAKLLPLWAGDGVQSITTWPPPGSIGGQGKKEMLCELRAARRG